MKLIEPTTEYCRQIRTYRKEFLDCGDSMDGTHGLREIEDPVKWIEHCALYKDPLTVPDSRVPATQYIFVREEDDRPQPRMDRNASGGMAATVGRLRKDAAMENSLKYVLVGHNTIRGAAGASILNAELINKQIL